MGWSAIGRAAGMAALATLLLAGAARAQPLPTLGSLEAGAWEIRAEGEPVRRMCVADPAAFVQVRHAGRACAQMLLASDARGATLHYSCGGAGWGRTTLRVSTPHLVTIDTQGIAANEPFAFTAEARRTGDCGAHAASLAR